jgi:GT2 family glycosyltransferase
VSVAILVLSVDEAPRLEASLPPAVAQAPVTVIDNACTDDTRAVAERHGAAVLTLPRRLSYAAAMNRALAAVEADAVLLLNADCILDEGFVAAAAAHLDEPGVGAVAPLVLRATGLRRADRLDVVDAAGMTLDRARKNGLRGHGEPAARYAQPAEVFGPDGACALYRRAVLQELGPEVLDEDMGLWATDADLAWRARARGWRTVYEPRARAWHVRFYSPTNRPNLPAEHRRLQFRNRLLMVLKNERGAAGLPRIALYEIAALGYALLKERDLLGGYVEAARLASRIWSKRSASVSASIAFSPRKNA